MMRFQPIFVFARRCSPLLGMAMMLGVVPSPAQVTVYTDKATFTTAAQVGGTLTFGYDLNSAAGSSGNVTLGAVTIVNANYYLFPNGNVSTTVDGSGYYRFDVDNGNTITFTFSSPVTAFGFETNPHPAGVGIALTANVGGTTVGWTMPATDVTEFRGFVSSTAFSSFVIGNPGSTTEIYGIDNLVGYGAVPEPGTYGVLVGGLLGGFVLSKRRRRA